MDSPLSKTSSIISILTFIVAILIWLGQHLDRAIKLDDEIATTGVMLIRSCGENLDLGDLSESQEFHKRLSEIWSFDLASLTVLREILQLSAPKRFVRWDKTRNLIRNNFKEVKRLKLSLNASTVLVLPK